MKTKKLYWLLMLVLSLVLLANPALADIVNIAILHTNDTNGHILPFRDESGHLVGGYSKRIAYFDAKRTAKGFVWLTLDSGNVYPGSQLSHLSKGELDVLLMNRAKYDASSLSIGEFYWGAKNLEYLQKIAKFPMLAANLKYSESGKLFNRGHLLLKNDKIRIAIIGLITPELMNLTHPGNIPGLYVEDPIKTATNLVPELRKQADVVIVLSSLGLETDIQLASTVPGINAILGGRSNSQLNSPYKVRDTEGNLTLIVQEGSNGARAGLLKLDMEGSMKSGYKMRAFAFRPVVLGPNIDGLPDLNKYLDDIQLHYDESLSKPVCTVTQNFNITNVRIATTAIGNLVADSIRHYAGADCAIVPGGLIVNGLRQGPISLRDAWAVWPGNDKVVTFTLSGQQLKDLLDRTSAMPGTVGYPQVSGLKYGITKGQAVNITVNEQPLDLTRSYTFATTDGVADGRYGYAIAALFPTPATRGKFVKDIFTYYLRTQKVLTPVLEERTYLLQSAPEEKPVVKEEEKPIVKQPEEEIPSIKKPEDVEPKTEPKSDIELLPENESTTPLAEAPETNQQPPVDTTEDTNEAKEDASTAAESKPESKPIEPKTDIIPQKTETEPEVKPTTEEPEIKGTTPTIHSDDPNVINIAQASKNGLVYTFTVRKKSLLGSNVFDFVLDVENTSKEVKILEFDSGEQYDFALLDQAGSLLWNSNFHVYFNTITTSVQIPAGTKQTFSKTWDGFNNQKERVVPGAYRFQAKTKDKTAPAWLEFEGLISAQN